MQTSNVTQKGQITVPADIRRNLGIKAGGKVRFSLKADGVLVEPVNEPAVESVFGVLKLPPSRSAADIDAAIEDAKMMRARKLTQRANQ